MTIIFLHLTLTLLLFTFSLTLVLVLILALTLAHHLLFLTHRFFSLVFFLSLRRLLLAVRFGVLSFSLSMCNTYVCLHTEQQ